MPRNTAGGSGHKAQKNSEGSKSRNNRLFIDALLDDYMNDEKTDGVHVARVLKRMGCGRMEVFYVDDSKQPIQVIQKIIPMRGGLRGKGKKSVWVDIDSLVMIAETGLAGATHEIVAVFSEIQTARFKKVKPTADPRLFLRSGSTDAATTDEGFVFEHEEEKKEEDVDIDCI